MTRREERRDAPPESAFDGCGATGCRNSAPDTLDKYEVSGEHPRVLCPRHALDWLQRHA